MTAYFRSSSSRSRTFLCALLGLVATSAFAQQAANPGDIIVERDVTPRIAYRHVPKDQDPVLARATTFPANSFDPMMATLVSDADLTNAHGSSGVAPGGVLGQAGVAAAVQVLTGTLAGPSITRGVTGAAAPTAGGIGGMISTTVTGAVQPLTSALGAIK